MVKPRHLLMSSFFWNVVPCRCPAPSNAFYLVRKIVLNYFSPIDFPLPLPLLHQVYRFFPSSTSYLLHGWVPNFSPAYGLLSPSPPYSPSNPTPSCSIFIALLGNHKVSPFESECAWNPSPAIARMLGGAHVKPLPPLMSHDPFNPFSVIGSSWFHHAMPSSPLLLLYSPHHLT